MALQERHIEHIKARQASGLTQGVYCQPHGLNVKTFSRWFRAYRLSKQPATPLLIPVEIKPAADTLPAIEPIWLAVSPVDMRRGIDGLSMVVQQSLGHVLYSGSAFVFRNRSGNRIKVVVWDGTGVWLCQRRLHEGRFIWPKVNDPCFSVTLEQWKWLIAGVDWQRLSAVPSANWQV